MLYETRPGPSVGEALARQGVWERSTRAFLDRDGLKPAGSDSRRRSPKAVLAREGREVLAWIQEDLESNDEWVTKLYVSEAASWRELGRVALSGLPGGWYPQAAIDLDGTIRAWGMGHDARGRFSLVAGESLDGQLFERADEWSFVAGAPDDWDGQGVLAAAATRLGEIVVLAYTAMDRHGVSRIGMAFAREGAALQKHAQNPVFIGSSADFDELGIEASTLEPGAAEVLEQYGAVATKVTARPEDVLLLWYSALGRREAGLACSSSTGDRDETWRVGWAALELVRADR